jgi:hypothetical protein
MKSLLVCFVTVAIALVSIRVQSAEVSIHGHSEGPMLQVIGETGSEWRFEASSTLDKWTNAPELGTLFSNQPFRKASTNTASEQMRFFRAVETDGLFDPRVFRTIRLYFAVSNWQTRLTSGRTTGSNTLCTLVLDNGLTNHAVGARYKGNTSFDMGGTKKSINLEIDFTNSTARLMGQKTVNLNNAAGDETIMREALYFNVMREFAPCPHGAMARVYINDAYWGVYSFVQQENSVLIDEWFPSNNGDRWRTPNFDMDAAMVWRGTNLTFYQRLYALQTDNSTNAWQRLVNAINVLNNTHTNLLRDKLEDVFAVDRWLWFLAVENIFADEDSYFFKGSDYSFYYEPESGRIHPLEHDGNEAFNQMEAQTSPVQGANQSNRPLLYRMLRIPELRQRYLAHTRTVLEERYNPAYLTPEIDRFRSLSVASIIADPKKNFSMSSYTNDLRALTTFITNRHRFLTNHAELRPLAPMIKVVVGPTNAPGPAEIPIITAQVEARDTNGIDSVWLYWRDQTYGRFSSAQMFDDGLHSDGPAGDGWYGGGTSNLPAGHKIHYYVEARAGNPAKAAAFMPARAEQQTFSYRVGLATAPTSPVVINEIMAANRDTIADPQGDFDDWIELRNITANEVDLAGRYLSDEPNNPRKWQFPVGTRIPANGYLIVWADEDGLAPIGLHSSFRLAAGGEELFLTDTDAALNAVLDSVTFGPQSDDISFGRTAADPDIFDFMAPTPGATNR